MPARVERVICICAHCGVSFEMYPSHMKRKGRGRFCSRDCAGLARRNGSTLQCAMCDSEFYRHLAEQDVGTKVNQFCSRKCYMDWRAFNMGPDTYAKRGAVHVHRIVAEATLGRPLMPREVVHHIDENKHNNHPSNLAVFPNQSYHQRCHMGGMSDVELRRFSLTQSGSA